MVITETAVQVMGPMEKNIAEQIGSGVLFLTVESEKTFRALEASGLPRFCEPLLRSRVRRRALVLGKWTSIVEYTLSPQRIDIVVCELGPKPMN